MRDARYRIWDLENWNWELGTGDLDFMMVDVKRLLLINPCHEVAKYNSQGQRPWKEYVTNM